MMTEDFSFIKLYKNDFDSAKNADDTPIQSIKHEGFIVQKPTETFYVKTAGNIPISFIGAIQIDFIGTNGLVIQNIDNNFYYYEYVDSSGINQIDFEFGLIGIDYWSTQLYLKITDLINGNIWYSNGFLVTQNNTKLSSRFDFTNRNKIFNISYDIKPGVQSIRFSSCYDQTPVNKEDLKQYINSSGFQTNYRTITTFLRKYLFSKIDYFVSDRFFALKSHQTVYLDGQRVVISDYKVEDRKFDVNFIGAEFTVNPQGERYTEQLQLFQAGYSIIELFVPHMYANNLSNFNTALSSGLFINFDKAVMLQPGFEYKLYKNGSLMLTTSVATIFGNKLMLTGLNSYSFTNGEYALTFGANLLGIGINLWAGFGLTDWNFEISNGQFDPSDFDGTDYLT